MQIDRRLRQIVLAVLFLVPLAFFATARPAAAQTQIIAINAGGPAVSPFVADKDFSGGNTIDHANTINTSKVTNPAPAAVYQSGRDTTAVGPGTTFSYTIGGFTAGTNYLVRLHFCETYFTAAGKRTFNVSINGTQVLTNFDIFATAGGQNIANIQQFTEAANSSGQYVILFTSEVNNALVSGIEIDSSSAVCTTVPSAPTGLMATAASSSQINLSWNAVTPPANCTISSYSIYRSTTSGFTPSSSNQIASGVTSTSYSNIGLAASTTYYYVVEAVDADGSSAPSTQASATTLNPILTVTLAGTPGTVTSSPSGIDCGSACSAPFTNNSAVTLTEVPPSGGTFLNWSGACTGTSTTCQVTMNGNETVTATFSQSYSWSNVAIEGGGYVPNVMFHPTEQNLLYARTDIGGAYRRGPNDSQWVPLLDWVNPDVWWYAGCDAIGVDPTDSNRLYIAVGEYAIPGGSGNSDGNGAMLVSDDQGATFTTVPLSFQNGSNDNGRNAGERIGVDPTTPSDVYFGSADAGMWLSTDHGSSWNNMTGFPSSVLSSNPGRTSNVGIVAVVPYSKNGSTPAVYAGVSGTGTGSDPKGLYVTTQAGSVSASWTAVSGQPTGMLVAHVVRGPNGNLYIDYINAEGPNGLTASAVWEFTPGSNWTSGTWRQITLPGTPIGGIAVDPSQSGVLLFSTVDHWSPSDTRYYSTNDGASWREVGHSGGSYNSSLSPYIGTGSQNWESGVAIDPYNSAHAIYGSGGTVWETTNLTAANSGNTVDWSIGAVGIEENDLNALVAPPTGNTILLSGMGDWTGFAHTNLSQSPSQGNIGNGVNGSAYFVSFDFVQNDPTTVVGVLQTGWSAYTGPGLGQISTNGGLNWSAFGSIPSGVTGKGTGMIAIAEDGSSVVWAPAETSSVWSSTNKGATWSAASGIPAQADVVSDRIKAGAYYGFKSGTLYGSTNGGQSWTTIQSGLPSSGTLLILPDAQGDLWLGTPSGLYHNTGTPTSVKLSQISGVSSVTFLTFGKAASGQTTPALYIWGTLPSGSLGLYQSINSGAGWTQINNDQHQGWGGVKLIEGDMRTFGTVYIGTNGRGIVWATSGN